MNIEDDKLFGIDIMSLYNSDLDKAYNLIKCNTNYLDNITFDEVKEIKFSDEKDIIILLRNGKLLFNGNEKLDNIKTLGFMEGMCVFAFSNDNVITCLTGNWKATNFLNNNNYKYKKIFISTLLIVALTYESDIKVYGLVDSAIDYKLYTDVEEIGYVEKNDDIVVIKNEKVYSLFVNYDYSNDKPDVIVEGCFSQFSEDKKNKTIDAAILVSND